MAMISTHQDPTGGMRASELVLDGAMPCFDVVITESAVVDADLTRTFEAARELDFLRVRTPLLAAAFWVRGLPERLGRRGPRAAPPRLVLGAGDRLPGWLVLGVVEGRELAFGAVGKFWQGAIEWRDVPRSQFARSSATSCAQRSSRSDEARR